MLKDLASQKKIDKEIIVSAIASLKNKGWDINPYSVADEAKVSRSVIFRNTEFMELVSLARGENPVAINQADSQASDNRTDELEQENQLLRARVNELERDTQNLAKSIQEAWQNGYQAGCKESLTIYNPPSPQPAETVSAQAEMPIQSEIPPLPQSALESEADSFTAKLYEALKVDGVLEEVSIAGSSELSPDIGMTATIDDMTVDQYIGSQIVETCTSDTEEEQQENNDATDDEIDDEEGEEYEEDHDETNPEFTERDLRSLVTNRFVRSEETPVENKEEKTAQNQTPLHKFVGTHRPNSEPAAVSPRMFPPEIRKACLMLGIRPHELTRQLVLKSWKDEIGKPGVHPDSGGDTEMAIYLNVAKDTLIRWIDTQSPKLGKKFGAAARTDKSHPEKTEE